MWYLEEDIIDGEVTLHKSVATKLNMESEKGGVVGLVSAVRNGGRGTSQKWGLWLVLKGLGGHLKSEHL